MERCEKNTVYTVQQLRDKLRPVFSSAPVYKAVLFGSYAKGGADADSDADIVIDSKRQLLNIKFFGVRAEIEDAIGKEVDLLEISELRQGSPIYEKIAEEGVVLYER